MTKIVEVASTNPRLFVEAILVLGAAGGTLPKEYPTYKGAFLRTKISVPDGAKFEVTNIMRVVENKEEVKKEVKTAVETKVVADEKYTREQLENMSLGEVRKATGIEKGGKEAIIAQYLGEAE